MNFPTDSALNAWVKVDRTKRRDSIIGGNSRELTHTHISDRVESKPTHPPAYVSTCQRKVFPKQSSVKTRKGENASSEANYITLQMYGFRLMVAISRLANASQTRYC